MSEPPYTLVQQSYKGFQFFTLADSLVPHSCNSARKHGSLSSGSLSWPTMVSILIYRYVKQVIGLSRLCSAIVTIICSTHGPGLPVTARTVVNGVV